MDLPAWLTVIPRPFPSAVMVVLHGPRPVVVDPGSLTDADQLPGLLTDAGVQPGQVDAVLCTHYHSDHVGAVAALPQHGAQVIAHAWDAAMVNRRDPAVCASRWLDQPVLPYRVDRAVQAGERISTGKVELEVLHTPGHTLGAVSLWEPDSRTLICGDALHDDDFPWIGEPHEGAGSLQRARLTLDHIEQLEPALIVSGHGPVIDEPAAAIARTRARLDRWAQDPQAGALHAAKRIFIYRLMLEPIPEADAHAYLLKAPWLRDLNRPLDQADEAFADHLLERLARALIVEDGLLKTTAPHRPSPVAVPWQHIDIAAWPGPDNHLR